MKMSKQKAVATVIREGRAYQKELVNTSILILYRDSQDNQLKMLEIEFLPGHYQHLTGLLLTKTDAATGNQIPREHTSMEFYRRCTHIPYITEAEVMFKDTEVADLKLEALPYITQITRITRMTGEYKNIRPFLEADYIIGGTNACIGISKYDDRDAYFPRSCLKADIRKVAVHTSQVLAIFQKPLPDDGSPYKHIRYVGKGVPLDRIILPKEIADRISLAEYTGCRKENTADRKRV
jgi:hypothetical protein